MSQVAHPHTSLPLVTRTRGVFFLLGGVLAALAVTAVVLVLVVGGESTNGGRALGAQPQSAPASTWSGRPDESRVAASIAGTVPTTESSGRPDESRVAASIAGR